MSIPTTIYLGNSQPCIPHRTWYPCHDGFFRISVITTKYTTKVACRSRPSGSDIIVTRTVQMCDLCVSFMRLADGRYMTN